jgi:hypothetical protein
MSLFGRNRGAVLLGKVESLQSLRKSREALAQFYVFLGVLDSKATGLLTVDAVLAAVLLAFLSSPEAICRLLHEPKPARVAAIQMVLECQVWLIGTSAFLCLLVVSVSWKMLDKVPSSPTHEHDFSEELRRLANIVDDRTRYYWVAWALTLCVFLLMLAWWSWCYFVGAAAVAIVWWCVRG